MRRDAGRHDDQGAIGPTATLPGARGQGVGHALVDAALTWAYDHGYQWVSVDFETANPLSRPFWLNAGFHPAGYGVLRLIDRRAASAEIFGRESVAEATPFILRCVIAFGCVRDCLYDWTLAGRPGRGRAAIPGALRCGVRHG